MGEQLRTVWALNVSVTLGKPQDFDETKVLGPDWTWFAASQWFANAPEPDLFLLFEAKINGETLFRVEEGLDAFGFAGSPVKPEKSTTFALRGQYTGKVPKGFKEGSTYVFVWSARGVAEIKS